MSRQQMRCGGYGDGRQPTIGIVTTMRVWWAIVVGCVISACDRTPAGIDGFPLTSSVLALFADVRPYQARFDDRQRHSTCGGDDTTSLTPTVRCAAVPGPAVHDLAALAPRVIAALQSDPSGDALWAAALLDLAASPRDASQLDRVISRLTEVRARDTTRAAPLNHRAIAHLARASIRGDARDVFSALDDIEHAYALDSSSLAIRFNRPLIHTLVKTHRLAARSWAASISAERDDGWRAEAVWREKALPRPRPLTVSFASGVGIEGDPQGAREFVLDSLLPRWAGARMAGDSLAAVASTAPLELIGRALLHRSGDSSVAHIAGDISATHAPPMAQGVAALLEGTRRYRLAEFVAAERELIHAVGVLERSNARVIADWARLLLGACRMNQQRFDEAVVILEDVGTRAAVRGDVALEARSLWARAIAVGRRGSLDDAESHFIRAESLFTRIGEARNAALLGTAIADVQGLTGRSMEAANSAYRSYTASVRAGSAVRHEDLLVVAQQLDEQGKSHAAVHLLNEAVLVATTSDRVKDLPEALGRLALVEASLGGRATPVATIAAARKAAQRVVDVAMRVRLDAELDRAEARVIANADPERAMDLIASARQQHFASIPVDDAALLLAEARLALHRGDSSAAASGLAAAVRKVQRLAPGARGRQARQLLATLRDAHRALIELALARGDTTAAFLQSVSLASLSPIAGRRADVRLDPIPPGRAELRFVVLPDRVLTWMRIGTTHSLESTEVSRKELALLIARFVNVIRAGDDHRVVRALGSELYRALVAPHEGGLQGVVALDVYADDVLVDLPLALLSDRSGRLLVERFATRFRVTTAEERRQPVTARDIRALLIDNPSWRQSDFPGLDELRWADDEIRQIRALYPIRTVLSGARATKHALLQAMPSHSLLHFAGHSRVVMEDPLTSHLVLAAGSGFGDGVLYASEIAGLRLDGVKLVVLSSCGPTGDGAAGTGEVNALAMAFLDAGVEAVIAGFWEADDELTSRLMATLHDALARGSPPDAALAASMTAILGNQQAPRGKLLAGLTFSVYSR